MAKGVDSRLEAVERNVARLQPDRPRFGSNDFRRGLATRVLPHLNPLAADGAVFAVSAEDTDVIQVAVQFSKGGGRIDINETVACPWYLASDAAGLTPSSVEPSGGVAAGTDGALIESIANLSGVMISEADGDVDVVLTEAGVATWYLVVILPNGRIAVSDAITFA